jgi:hypothetical protein
MSRPRGAIASFERRGEPLLPRHRFVSRLLRAALIWLLLTLGGLAIGMAGYAATEGMSIVDAFVNAAMILSGMGPVGELRSSGGKIFAGFYAIFSGLLIVIASGFVLAPIIHRVLHAFHVEEGPEKDD